MAHSPLFCDFVYYGIVMKYARYLKADNHVQGIFGMFEYYNHGCYFHTTKAAEACELTTL